MRFIKYTAGDFAPEEPSDNRVDGDDANPHQIRTTSTREYYHSCGFDAASRKRQSWKRQDQLVGNIIDRIPTVKTSSQDALILAITYVFSHFSAIMNFYDRDFQFNSLKFKNYGNKQRALSEISRRLTVGSRKYGEAAQEPANRPLPHWSHLPSTDTAADDHHIYLAFGNGSWGAGKEKVPAPTKRLLTHLRQIARLPPPPANRPARPMVTLIMLDEYLTSQICANCHQRTLEHVPATKGQAHPKIHAVLKCNSCRTAATYVLPTTKCHGLACNGGARWLL